MRLGAEVFYKGKNPEEFVLAHVKKGYRSCLCPSFVDLEDKQMIRDTKQALKKYDIYLAEVGAWCNPLHPDKQQAEKNIQYMIRQLELAEELEAVTCVNLVGSKHPSRWYAPSREVYTEAFFEEAVKTMQRIIDAVSPTKTTLSFETMPYSFLDSPDEYLRFIQAIDRRAVRVHLDICNCINDPRRYYDNTRFIQTTFATLRPYIVSLHLKDIWMSDEAVTVKFDEVPIGQGNIDYLTLIKEVETLPDDTPALIEHLPSEEAYQLAMETLSHYIQS